MKMQKLALLLIGMLLGVALATSVIQVKADNAKTDETAQALKTIIEQNEKLLKGQEEVMKQLGEMNTDIAFIKAASRR